MLQILKDIVGDTLYFKRLEFDFTQSQMAERCQISNRQYNDLENKKRLPELQTFIRIAVICKIDINKVVSQIIEKGYKVS